MKRIKIVNIQLIVLAMWLYSYGLKLLSYLTNIYIANTLRSTGSIAAPQFSAVEITEFAIVIIYAYIVGYVLASVFSFVLSGRKRIDLFESLASLAIFICLSRFDLTGWKYFAVIVLAPGSVCKNFWYFVINGGLLVLWGTLILLIKRRMDMKRQTKLVL